MSAWSATQSLPLSIGQKWLTWAAAIALFVTFFQGMIRIPRSATNLGSVADLPSFASLSAASIGKIKGAEPHEFLARVQQDDSVRVIVELDVPFTPAGELDAQATADQQLDIASTQYRLVRNMDSEELSGVYGFRYIPLMVMTVDAAGLQALLDSDLVNSVQEDVLEAYSLDSSIPIIGADQAWAAGYSGSGRTIAILDTGVDKTHPFVSGRVVSEACYSTNSTAATGYTAYSVCPDGVISSTAEGSAMPYVNSCPEGYCDHGTHVAGIAGGNGPSAGESFSGVARNVNFIAIQVFSRIDDNILPTNPCGFVGECALSYSSDQIKGMQRVYELRNTYSIDSINISIGGTIEYTSYCDTDPRKTIIDTLRSVGIVTVISAGNSGFSNGLAAPACISSAVSVGATTDSDEVASYSNTASYLVVMAPGSSIYSSVPGDGYESWDGTSMAAPHVTGTFAILRQRSPNITIDEILNLLTTYGTPVTDTDPEPDITKPRINVDDALNHINSPTDITAGSAPENQTDALISLSTTDPDTGNTFTYTLVSGDGDTDNELFEIVSNQLYTVSSFDFESTPTASIRIRSTDNTAMWYEEALTIDITDVNETPTDIALGNASVPENHPTGTVAGAFSSTDPDADDTFTYTLASGTGDSGNSAFQIVGGQLQTVQSFDYETQSSYSIRVRTTDSGSLWYEKVFTIAITDYDNPYDIALSNTSVGENYAGGVLVGTLSSLDDNADATFTYALASGDGDTDNTCFQIIGAQLFTTCLFDYEIIPHTRSVRIRTTDNTTLWNEAEFTINIIDRLELFLPLLIKN